MSEFPTRNLAALNPALPGSNVGVPCCHVARPIGGPRPTFRL